VSPFFYYFNGCYFIYFPVPNEYMKNCHCDIHIKSPWCVNTLHKHYSWGYHSLLWNMVWITSWRVGSHVCIPMTYFGWYGIQQWWWRWTYQRWWWDHGVQWVHDLEQNDLPMGGIVRSNEIVNSSTPMETTFA